MDLNFHHYRIAFKNYIVLYNNDGTFNCEVSIKPNDIFESGNIIVAAGKNMMQVFEFIPKNINNNAQLIKKCDIIINNNNNNNNNFNDNNVNSDNEIMCIHQANKYLLCGHKDGNISIWEFDPKEFLKKKHNIKLHLNSINQILYTQLSNGKNYFISCSSDCYLKLYSMDDDKVEKEINLGREVMEVKMVKDLNNQNIFFASLYNGEIFALNEDLQKTEIPSRFKTKNLRKVISLKNPGADGNQGDFILITEGKQVDVFCFVKEAQKNVQNFAGGFNQGPHRGMPYPFKGNFHRGRGGY